MDHARNGTPLDRARNRTPATREAENGRPCLRFFPFKYWRLSFMQTPIQYTDICAWIQQKITLDTNIHMRHINLNTTINLSINTHDTRRKHVDIIHFCTHAQIQDTYIHTHTQKQIHIHTCEMIQYTYTHTYTRTRRNGTHKKQRANVHPCTRDER